MADTKFTIRIGGDSRQFAKTVSGVKRQLGDFKRAVFSVQGALAGIGASVTLGAIVKATERQAQAIRQLETRIKSTGGAAGKTSAQLVKFAGELQKITTFGDEAVIEMQSLLLTFTEISGPQFDRATRSVLDMSVAMGTDLKSAALQVGKALNDPVRGLSALSRSGIQFNESQRETIKQLQETGRVAEAQTIILEELERQFGGSAQAATETLGGALQQLQNAFGDLLEADGVGMNGAIEATRELTALLQDPNTVAGMNNITTAVIKFTEWVVKAAVAVGNLARGAGEFFAEFIHGSADPLERARERLEELETNISGRNATPAKKREREQAIAQQKQIIAQLEKEREAYEKLQKEIAEAKAEAATGPGALTPTGAGTPTPTRTGAGTKAPKGFGDALEAAVQRQNEAAERIADGYRRAAESVKDNLDPVRALNRELEANRDLYERGYLSAEEYARAQQDVQRRIGEVGREFEVLDEKIEATGEQLNQFGVQAARNIQSTLADFLFDPFKDGLDGMVQGFGRALQRMAADAAAAQIAKYLFGDFGGGGGGGGIGGAVGSIFSAGKSILSSLFHSGGIAGGPAPTRRVPALAFAGAPHFAQGGEVPAILHAGEEVLTRKDPRHRANGGGLSVVNNFTIQGDASRETQEQIAGKVGDAISRAMRRNR